MTNRFHFRLLLQVLLAALVLNVIVPGVSAANAEECVHAAIPPLEIYIRCRNIFSDVE